MKTFRDYYKFASVIQRSQDEKYVQFFPDCWKTMTPDEKIPMSLCELFYHLKESRKIKTLVSELHSQMESLPYASRKAFENFCEVLAQAEIFVSEYHLKILHQQKANVRCRQDRNKEQYSNPAKKKGNLKKGIGQ